MKTPILTDGIVIKSAPFFEKNQLVTVFTRSYGKINILAKQPNKKSTAFSGLLTAGTLAKFRLSPGKSFWYLSHAELIQSFLKIREQYNRIAVMAHFFDIVSGATSFHQENEPLFEVLRAGLTDLDSAAELNTVQADFYYSFLRIEGLLDNRQQPISIYEFSQYYYQYTGASIQSPELIPPPIFDKV